MTRNEAYKLAKQEWRRHSRLALDSQNHAYTTFIMSLRAQGFDYKDVDLVKAWYKAFRQGKRYPENFLK
jgi:hypothetical protein